MLTLPPSIAAFFALFPLRTNPPIYPPSKKPITAPTLWIIPTNPSHSLSNDVECLKWQAYLALRGLTNIHIRTDVHPEGAIDGRLPNLHVPPSAEKKSDDDGQLLAAHLIPAWVDTQTTTVDPDLEGYIDAAARDESRAWVALLEGTVHAALLFSQPSPSYLERFLSISISSPLSFSWSSDAPTSNAASNTTPSPSLQTLITPPPPPATGVTSLFPASGVRISPTAILTQYRDAIAALSERLGTDQWFLGSSGPTALDALAFAYIHTLIESQSDTLRVEVCRRVNLVGWEKRVRETVDSAFRREAR
ncbi:hypothetical protein AMATHDRAFT_72686 [Amanita thiersii Skay4041]|uniref:Metaxin glutathione S-transferase domain-containing protein n=1 Tax=Amanita thiersii Skay4041 TaxID=703135 RepID=A0A2A9NUD5_9AGAR|nr:hypothetical protein AMATHDRAFT_72686 [Amanita thiersii Skay4041]